MELLPVCIGFLIKLVHRVKKPYSPFFLSFTLVFACYVLANPNPLKEKKIDSPHCSAFVSANAFLNYTFLVLTMVP